jgi:hypothetical protein
MLRLMVCLLVSLAACANVVGCGESSSTLTRATRKPTGTTTPGQPGRRATGLKACSAHPTSADLVIDYEHPRIVHVERHIDKGANSLYHDVCGFLATAWHQKEGLVGVNCPSASGAGGVKISFSEGKPRVYSVDLSFIGCDGMSDDQGRYGLGFAKNLDTFNRVVAQIGDSFSVSRAELSGNVSPH